MLKCIFSRFEIDSGHNSVPDGVFINITSARCDNVTWRIIIVTLGWPGTYFRHRLVFEMIPGYHTQNLVSELYRITETVSKQIPTSSSGFAWLSKYKSTGKSDIMLNKPFYCNQCIRPMPLPFCVTTYLLIHNVNVNVSRAVRAIFSHIGFLIKQRK